MALKLRKSLGVRVSIAVHAMLARGNRARDRRDWEGAAAAYTQALQADPSLVHIWVQLGHSLKEQGLLREGRAAYMRAAELKPGDPDAHLHLGHMSHVSNDQNAAGRHYLAAFRADPHHADAALALQRAIAMARGRTRTELRAYVRSVLGVSADGGPAAVRTDARGLACLAFDASDLISYFGNARLPTGIQRVQIEAIDHAVRRGDRDVRVCCFMEGQDEWLEIPVRQLQELAALSLIGGERDDPAWVTALNALHLQLCIAPPLEFPRGAMLVNLGTSWWLQNYFLFVRAAKARYGIRYVPFVHDFIPIVAPEHCTTGLTRDFISWALGVFSHADHYLVNSEATRRDLIRVAAMLGHEVDPGNVSTITLDADFRKAGMAALPMGALAKWGLKEGGFVLLVSTVESRKGHTVALDAWLELIGRNGLEAVPILVCVGNKGWLNNAVYARLERHEGLASRVKMLSGLSDAELSLLYRGCRFTIYPSLYEGWGLPITESLCYGKPVVTCDNSSLPEAGGAFAVYVPTGSVPALAAAVERLVSDGGHYRAMVAKIEAEFRPRSWNDVAAQIGRELERLSARAGGRARPSPRPVAHLGDYHSLARNMAVRIWHGAASGEGFRAGTGWRVPGHDGAWTAPKGGELAIGLPAVQGPLRLGLLLIGQRDRDIDWRLTLDGGRVRAGTLTASRRKWVLTTVPAPGAGPDGATLRLHLHATPVEIDPAWREDDEAMVGVAGFFVYPGDDAAAGMRILEAIALDNLDDIEAYRARDEAGEDGWQF